MEFYFSCEINKFDTDRNFLMVKTLYENDIFYSIQHNDISNFIS